jgi:hypothetical protein
MFGCTPAFVGYVAALPRAQRKPTVRAREERAREGCWGEEEGVLVVGVCFFFFLPFMFFLKSGCSVIQSLGAGGRVSLPFRELDALDKEGCPRRIKPRVVVLSMTVSEYRVLVRRNACEMNIAYVVVVYFERCCKHQETWERRARISSSAAPLEYRSEVYVRKIGIIRVLHQLGNQFCSTTPLQDASHSKLEFAE